MKKIFIVLVFIILTLSSCSIKREINEVINNVTNNITEERVTVNDYSIDDLEDAVVECIKKVENSVVGVTMKKETTVKIDMVDCVFYDSVSIGSAVIYKRIENYDGDTLVNYTYYAFTNEHVVNDDSIADPKIFIYIDDGALEIEAEVLGTDAKMDLAVVKFSTYRYIEPVTIGDSDKVNKGSMVVSIGNPEGYQYYGSASLGIVSKNHVFKNSDTDNDGVSDFVCEYIQTDASINPGNSGGGLFTLDGKFIGIPSLKLVGTNIDNMGFAIPSNMISIAASEYLELGLDIIRPRFGITTVTVRDANSAFMSEYKITSWPNIYDGENPYGLYVTDKSNKGTLKDIDVEKNDILLAIDGVKLYNNYDLSGRLNSLSMYQVGDEVELTYYDASVKEIKTINITLKQE